MKKGDKLLNEDPGLKHVDTRMSFYNLQQTKLTSEPVGTSAVMFDSESVDGVDFHKCEPALESVDLNSSGAGRTIDLKDEHQPTGHCLICEK